MILIRPLILRENIEKLEKHCQMKVEAEWTVVHFCQVFSYYEIRPQHSWA